MRLQLEDLRQMLSTDKTYFAIAKITRVHIRADRSSVRCDCDILNEGEDRNVLARVASSVVGPNSGDFQRPAVNDMVLLAFVDGNADLAFIFARLSSNEDTIPVNSDSGDRVIKSLESKNVWITGQNKVNITKTDAEPDQNLVLGQVFKKFASDLIDRINEALDILATETHTSSMPGFPSSPPTQAAQYTALKTKLNALKDSPIVDEAILSSYAYTSKE